MSCYFRHLKDIFGEVGIVVTSSNRKAIDQAIHQIVGSSYKDCPDTWRKLKKQALSNEQQRQDLITKLTNAIK